MSYQGSKWDAMNQHIQKRVRAELWENLWIPLIGACIGSFIYNTWIQDDYATASSASLYIFAASQEAAITRCDCDFGICGCGLP